MTAKAFRIFFDESVILIGDGFSEVMVDKKFTVANKDDICKLLDSNFELDEDYELFLEGYETERLFNDFCACFNLIEAAGGVVKDHHGQFLFIKRFGIWDLPKGKMEKNENPKQCAIREVIEETGISSLTIVGQLPPTYHVYFRNDKRILKKTYWYAMSAPSGQALSPQIIEDITEARWLKLNESKDALKNSYRSLRETLLPYFTY